MNKRNSLNIGGMICVVIAVYLLYHILLRENTIFPLSLHSIIEHVHHWTRNWHILTIGLLPIYLALMIFGTAILGCYLGSALQRWISVFLQQK